MLSKEVGRPTSGLEVSPLISFEPPHESLKDKKSLPDLISEGIIKLISDGTITKGAKLPSEAKLAQDFNVSRNVIREALNRLAIYGYVSRRHGVGTFVISTKPILQAGIESLESITDFIDAAGYIPGTRNKQIWKGPVDKIIQDHLEIPEGEEAIQIKRIRTADNRPIVLAYAVLNPVFFSSLETFSLEESLFDFIAANRIHLTHSLCYIKTKVATHEESEQLECNEGDSLLCLEQIFYNSRNQAVLYSYSSYNDRLMTFKVIRKR